MMRALRLTPLSSSVAIRSVVLSGPKRLISTSVVPWVAMMCRPPVLTTKL